MTFIDRPTQLVPVIISGGSGSRLWPLSRESHPKPFIKMLDGQSLIQKTFLRASALENVEQIYVVTNQELLFHSKHDYQDLQLNLPLKHLLEPVGRNTAPAIAAAVVALAATHPIDTVVAILPADHLITNQQSFQAVVELASETAKQGYLVSLGVQPTHPETGYGYIELGNPLAFTDLGQAFTVKRFVEKPDLERAKQFVDDKQHVWNAGMFFFTLETFINEMQKFAPEIMQAVQASLDPQTLQNEIITLDRESFIQATNISIDYALMEKSSKVAVVTGDFDWSDIGSWKAMNDLSQPDVNGNSIVGECTAFETYNCYIHGDNRVIATAGVKDLVIVDTADALLVADRSSTQDVKHLVEKLKLSDSEVVKLHREVHRPWGSFTVLGVGEGFKIKLIKVHPGAALSLQMHYHRSEHWVVVKGTAKTTNGDTVSLVNTNESIYIPAGHTHRLENPGKVELQIVEVQCGAYLGEDDIVRFEDKYQRVN